VARPEGKLDKLARHCQAVILRKNFVREIRRASADETELHVLICSHMFHA
jgi:hypothetical protein